MRLNLNESEWALLVVAVGEYILNRTADMNLGDLKSNIAITEHPALMATGRALSYKLRMPDREPAWEDLSPRAVVLPKTIDTVIASPSSRSAWRNGN